MKHTRIDITTLDGLTDTILTDQRPKQKGVNTVDLITDGYYRRIDISEYKQQYVQSITWDSYEINVIALEDYGLELLKYAKNVTINSSNDTVIHDAVVTNVSREQASDSDFTNVTIEYYDTRLSNYKYGEPPVHEFLKSDAIALQYPIDQRVFMRIINSRDGSLYDFNTMLLFETTAKQPEYSNFNNTQSGATITTNAIVKQQIEGIFYLNGVDIQPFQSVLPLAEGYYIKAFFYMNGTSYQIDEMPEVSVEKLDGWDIWKGTVNFVYKIINHYPYSDASASGGGTTF